ncbi:MAG: DUF2314 domain-containing protein, partial [Rubripirellula sp.]
MKPITRMPGYGLGIASLWAFLLGGLMLYFALFVGQSDLSLALGVVFTVLGIGIWQEQRWAVTMTMVLFALMAINHGLGLISNFQIKGLIYFLGFGVMAKDCWKGQERLKLGQRDLPDSNVVLDAQDESEDEDGKPMVSLVLLQRSSKYLEDMVLAKIAESAFGVPFSAGDDEATENFIVGEKPIFFVSAPSGMYLVHNHDTPYWEDKDEVLEHVNELRLAKAISDHEAWLSVDLISSKDESQAIETHYPAIVRMIHELADDDTLAMLQPEAMHINVWSEEMADRIARGENIEGLFQNDNVPVIPIQDDDPEMVKAVNTAKNRWPEFVTEYQKSRGEEDHEARSFTVKAKITRGDSIEFIWVNVIGLEPKYVHGNLANDPVDLGDLKLGSQVEFPIEDVCDWCYLENDEPV